MTHVTPEEAWVLKKTGFPQPPVRVGQLWANAFCCASEIYGQHIYRGFLARKVHDKSSRTRYMKEDYIRTTAAYMPTLKELEDYERSL